MPKNYNTYEVDAHSVHESESYAEVFALMMLEREGLQGTGRTRALLRNLYTQEMGQWFIDNPQNAFGNQLYLKGGLIYYLAPTLLATDEFVSRNREFVKGAVDELLLKAGEIVKEYSVDGEENEHEVNSTTFEWDAKEKKLDFKKTYVSYPNMLIRIDEENDYFRLLTGDVNGDSKIDLIYNNILCIDIQFVSN